MSVASFLTASCSPYKAGPQLIVLGKRSTSNGSELTARIQSIHPEEGDYLVLFQGIADGSPQNNTAEPLATNGRGEIWNMLGFRTRGDTADTNVNVYYIPLGKRWFSETNGIATAAAGGTDASKVEIFAILRNADMRTLKIASQSRANGGDCGSARLFGMTGFETLFAVNAAANNAGNPSFSGRTFTQALRGAQEAQGSDTNDITIRVSQQGNTEAFSGISGRYYNYAAGYAQQASGSSTGGSAVFMLLAASGC